MRAAWSVVLGLVAVFALVAGLQAKEKKSKEVTLKGTITCARCDLKKSKTCHTVIVVKKGDKETVYWLDKKGKYEHKPICKEAKKGSVTGTVTEKNGKKWIHATKIKFEE